MDTDSGRINGYIHNITDTTVTISDDFLAYNDSISVNYEGLRTFNYYNIKNVEQVRKGSIPIGALLGGVTGALIGLATYQKPEPNQWVTIDFGPGLPAAIGSIVGGGVGALIGALARKNKFDIDKDINNFRLFKSSLQ